MDPTDPGPERNVGIAGADSLKVEETRDQETMHTFPHQSEALNLFETQLYSQAMQETAPAEATHFHFDENMLRSLQQFMEGQGLHPHSGDQTAIGPDGAVKETSLAEGLAQHYLPTRQEIKAETEEERKQRALRVRLENRERKKRWREQNADRNKDNDLRCRVNKRANLIYGNGPSPEKDAFIEEEFKKRQRKRKGKISSPSPEDERLHASVHNPEFANVLMMVLLQKGLSQEDATSLLETLKSNPEALKSFMATSTGAPAESTEEQQDETTNEAEEMSEVPQYMLHTTEYVDTHGLDASQILLASQGLPFENMPTDSTEYATELPPELQSHLDEERAMPISIQIPVPIPVQSPAMEVKNEPVAEAIPIPPVPPMPPLHVTPVRQPIPTIPMPPMNYPPIPPLPTYIPPATPPASTSQPLSQDRVRALGFPPRMAQPPQTAQPKATHSA